jgi:hypothetical protein
MPARGLMALRLGRGFTFVAYFAGNLTATLVTGRDRRPEDNNDLMGKSCAVEDLLGVNTHLAVHPAMAQFIVCLLIGVTGCTLGHRRGSCKPRRGARFSARTAHWTATTRFLKYDRRCSDAVKSSQ